MEGWLPPELLEALRQVNGCRVADAIEMFQVRLRHEGFASDNSVHCLFKNLPPMVGYAVTGRIRTESPPLASTVPPPRQLVFVDRRDWWNHILSMPAPRVLVMQDIDRSPGFASLFGRVHTPIGKALGCVGYVTNGAVRDLEAAERIGFHFFAGHVSISRAYAHVVDFGEPVEIGGLRIAPGDLVHGDQHGIQTIPRSVAAQIPAMAALLMEKERAVIEYCQSPDFSLPKLQALLRQVGEPPVLEPVTVNQSGKDQKRR